jgi:murein DD-endopeptidase MepM/ murein hydrolase activator NlpD
MHLKLLLALAVSAIGLVLGAGPASAWHDYYNPASYTTPVTKCYPITQWTHPNNPEPYNRLAVDIGMDVGTSVWATKSGKVVFAGWDGPGGWTVKIQHYDSPYNSGLQTILAHLSRIDVAYGQWVTKDYTRIGLSGRSGTVTGPHLHWALWEPEAWDAVPLNNIPGVYEPNWICA